MQLIRLSAVVLSLAGILSAFVCGSDFAEGAEACVEASPITSGQTATCSGVLWPKDWSVNAVSCLSIDLPEEKEGHEITRRALTGCSGDFDALQIAHAESVRKLEEISRDAAGITRAWHDSKWLWLSVGLVGGGLLVYAGQ